jgi:hypothetical protein
MVIAWALMVAAIRHYPSEVGAGAPSRVAVPV